MQHTDLFYTLLPAAILLLPLFGAVMLWAFGKYADEAADKLSVGLMFLAFDLSLVLFFGLTREHGVFAQSQPVIVSADWISLGGVVLPVGFLIDNLSAFFCIIVTGLGTLVMLYSIFYMRGDTMYRRYFAYMNFFCFSMLGVVLSNNLLMTYVFWELVGLGSYFLIGFWFYKPAAARDHHYQELKAAGATGIDERFLSPAFAQKKAFVMNRIGDFGFITGIAFFVTVMLAAAQLPGFQALDLRHGPLNFDKLYEAKRLGVFDSVSLLGLTGPTLLTLAGIFTFMGAIGKSAQFPLHTWLPDAMQGPTTGSSIIHAATMVAAGVYMTARIHPLLTPGSLFFVAMIGGITAILAATMALVQWDIKAVLAYSTISQLGYMMIGLGAGAYTAGLAHLFTHAIFKCMLFLCAGAVIVGCHHLQDMHRMGGLRRKMPITFATMLIGTLAITGVPLFSGFFSKDAILAGSLARALELGGVHWFPTLLAFVTAGLTACYMFRLIFMTFYGEPRDAHVYAHAHEAPAVATVPLCILATFCLGFWWSGHLNLVVADVPLPGVSVKTPDGVRRGWVEALITSPTAPVPGTPAALARAEEAEYQEHVHHQAHLVATGLSLLMLALGFAAAYALYIQRKVTPERLLQVAPLRTLFTVFSELWFFDRLYQDGLVPLAKRVNGLLGAFDMRWLDGVAVDGWAPVARAGATAARVFDDWVVDLLVDAVGWITWFFGQAVRVFQAGKIQFYVCVTFGVAVLAWLGVLWMWP